MLLLLIEYQTIINIYRIYLDKGLIFDMNNLLMKNNVSRNKAR